MMKTLLFSVALVGSAAMADPLSVYLWRNRVLLVFAPRADDPRLGDQRAMVGALSRSGGKRDLVTLEFAPGGPGQSLRQRFGVDPRAFDVILIGKDGGVKLKANHVLPAQALAATIDAMPMRQDEVRREKTGSWSPSTKDPR